MIHTIDTRDEFDLCLKHGVNPLFWNKSIKMSIILRIALQDELFGSAMPFTGSTAQENERYYRYCWAQSGKVCENCARPLNAMRNEDNLYSAIYISHIISRGARADMSHDPRNQNTLCPKCHSKWEIGKRIEMFIYIPNQIRIVEMMMDYIG